MGVKAGSDQQRYCPKSLEEIDKHFKIWSQSKVKTLTNLKKKSIYPLSVEGAYAKQARQQLVDFGKLYHRKVHKAV